MVMIRGLLWIVRCTVWSISHITNCILGMHQSELFSFTDIYLIFAATNVKLFDDQLDTISNVSVEYIFTDCAY